MHRRFDKVNECEGQRIVTKTRVYLVGFYAWPTLKLDVYEVLFIEMR